MAPLLTPDRPASHTQCTHSVSLSSYPSPTHTPPRHTPMFSVLELALGCTPVGSAQYSTLPKSTSLPLSLFIVQRRPRITTVIVVSQQSIGCRCETAAPLKTRPHSDLAPPLLSPDICALEPQPAAWLSQSPLVLLLPSRCCTGIPPI